MGVLDRDEVFKTLGDSGTFALGCIAGTSLQLRRGGERQRKDRDERRCCSFPRHCSPATNPTATRGDDWKGAPGRSVILYGVDAGTDCLGDGGYEIGKNYLVYAAERDVKDVMVDGSLWYGWSDVLPQRTKMPEKLGKGLIPADQHKRP